MTETKQWALRKSPTVPQEAVQLSDGRWVGIINGMSQWWPKNGMLISSEHPLDLVPLQVPPKKTLRCWASDRGSYVALNQYDPITHNSLSPGWVEMIERAPGDKLAEEVKRHSMGWGLNIEGLKQALREYDEATK